MQSTKLLICLLGLLSALRGNLVAQDFKEQLDVDYVNANCNDLNHLNSEIGKLASSCQIATDGVTAKLTTLGNSSIFELNVVGSGSSDHRAKALFGMLRTYFCLRLSGHSREYSRFLTIHGNDGWPRALKAIEQNPSAKKMIAFPWIDREIHGSLFFLNADNRAVYVIDKDLAWLFCLPRKGAEFQGVQYRRFDAIEFNPKHSRIIHAVFNRLMRNPNSKDWKSWEWWNQFGSHLKSATGLEWRSPIELNPAVNFD